jgi:Xaa-Pro aminopeptidase
MSITDYIPPAAAELEGRISRLHAMLGAGWDICLIAGRVNGYYLTGTMQDGMFALRSDGSYAYFVRRSYERALEESPLRGHVYAMSGYKDMADFIGDGFKTAYIDAEVMPHAMIERLRKYFPFETLLAADRQLSRVRALKSAYEIAIMRESGREHAYVFSTLVPYLLREGRMSEASFTADLYAEMVKAGYHGVTRFAMFGTEMVIGQIGFGENSLVASNFDGPGGMRGICPAVPLIGDRSRFLAYGDLVFIDIGYGAYGYHTDRTQVYSIGPPPPEAVNAHRECMRIQREIAAALVPGAVPDDIYKKTMAGLPPGFAENFMGFGKRRAAFLGHGVGLHVDEYPVLARGFFEPLAEGMTIAVEPKKGIPGVGMVGVEDTYLVTAGGGECLTGGESGIIVV